MSSEEVKVEMAGPGRRLLTKVHYSLSPGNIINCENRSRPENVVEPLIVECPSPKTSFGLAFDVLLEDRHSDTTVNVEVRDVDAPNNVTLQLEATVEWHKRPAGSNVSRETDRSKWPAPEPPVKVTLNGPGKIGHFPLATLRALTVHLEVYAVGDYTLTAMVGGLNALRLDKTLTDVELKVDGQVFPAHRNVLAANSPVFFSMFTSNLKEAQEGVVDIEGTSSEVFGLFLEFLYSAGVADWKGCEMELLELADRYMVEHLKAVCEERLLEMEPSTALRILEKADTTVITSDLREQAIRTVVKNWEAVSETQQWKDFQTACPVLAVAILVAQQIYAELGVLKDQLAEIRASHGRGQANYRHIYYE